MQFGTPEEIYRAPVDDFIARFVGYANALPVLLGNGGARLEADGSVLDAPSVKFSGPATAFIHASAVVLESTDGAGPNRFACTVADAAFMGDHVEYVLTHKSGLQLKARTAMGSPVYTRGSEVAARLPPDKLIVVPRSAAR